MGRKMERFQIVSGVIVSIRCGRCREWLSPDQFHFGIRKKYSAVCKDCNKELQKMQYLKKKKNKKLKLLEEKKKKDEDIQEPILPHWYKGRYCLINPSLREWKI